MSTSRESTFGPGAAGSLPGYPALDGPRTALPLEGGHPRHLTAHLDRLAAGAAALGWTVPWLTEAAEALRLWLGGACADMAALRLGLSPREGRLHARLEPLPQPLSPYPLALLPHPMGDLRPSPLARHKGLSGPWRLPALVEARRRGAVDALLTWPDGTVAETTLAAVALEREGKLFLPPPEGRVASLAERLDLPAWAQARGLTCVTRPLQAEDCQEGQLWCLNALRGIWPAEILWHDSPGARD